MFNTIRKKLIAGFSIILVIVIMSTLYNLYIYNNSRTHIINIREKAIASFKYSSEMKNNVIQVSQYLSDMSASKNVEHLQSAEKQYNLFIENLGKLAGLNPEDKSDLDEINGEFTQLFTFGKEMAEMYITSGHDQGNVMMEEFDKQAESLYQKVETIIKNSEDSMDESLITIEMHMKMNQEVAVALAIGTVILALIIAYLLASSITTPIKNLLEIFKDLELGQGDLTRRINIKSKDEIAKMSQSFNNYLDSLRDMVINIKKHSSIVTHEAEILSVGSDHTADEVAVINNLMSRVAKDTQNISTSISQITSSISEIAQTSQTSAIDANQISIEADNISSLAQASGKVAYETKLAMENTEDISANTIIVAERLGKEAGEIGKIIDTIKSITDQTNLLALNAAVEAARAGEQGRGFGVVADEIRKLAESTSSSTKTIENMVKNIQNMIHNTIEATAAVGEKIKQGSKMAENVYLQLDHIVKGIININERIQNIAAGTEEQSASTEELSATMEAINISNTAITTAMEEVAASVSAQTQAITGLSSTASNLNGSAEQFKGLVGKFKV